VSPQETFECSLGVDQAIRVTYPPRSKREQMAGFISRQQSIRLQQKITIKNTRSSPILIQVIDQLPISEEERLQVRLIEPHLSSSGTTKKHGNDKEDTEELRLVPTGPKNPRQNDKGHLEWVLRLESNKTENLQFSYELLFPTGETVSGI
jgi:uncharacterized protein (TIGR02231 family)